MSIIYQIGSWVIYKYEPVDDATFLNNLAKTCQSQSIIRDDGEKWTIWDTFAYWRGDRSGRDHFSTTLVRLNGLLFKDCYKKLSTSDKNAICRRVEAIADKLGLYPHELSPDQFVALYEKFKVKRGAKFNLDTFHAFHEKLKIGISKTNFGDNDFWKYRSVAFDLYNTLMNYFNEHPTQYKAIDTYGNPTNSLCQERETLMNMISEYNDLMDSMTEGQLKGEKGIKTILFELETFSWSNEKLIKKLPEIVTQNEAELAPWLLTMLDDSLERSLFANGVYLSDRLDMPNFDPIFQFVNTHIDKVDADLALRLRLKFSNLPCRAPRKTFDKLILSEEDQKVLLKKELEREVEKHKKEILENLDSLTFRKTEQIVKLRTMLELDESQLKDRPLNEEASPLVENFFHASKTLRELESNTWKIPFWYHSTPLENYQGIWESGTIHVNSKKRFKGSWTSDKPEDEPIKSDLSVAATDPFGPITFALTDQICTSAPEVVIGYKFANRRWRGLQSEIVIEKKVAFIAATREHKGELRHFLTDKSDKTQVMSKEREHYLYQAIKNSLGNPNLEWDWYFGKKFAT